MKKFTLLLGLFVFTFYACDQDDDFPNGNGQTVVKNPIAYYPFNGNSLDEVGANDGTVDGATLTSDINDFANSAYRFDGVDDIIRVPHNLAFNLTNEFTISAFVKAEDIKTQDILRKGDAVNGSTTWPYGLSLSETGDIIFTVSTDFGAEINQVRKAGYLTNTWYLITGVFKDSTMYLYVNGVLEATLEVTTEVTTNTSPLLIGSRLGLPSDTFQGTIDEVRIYDVALELSDILELYSGF